MQLAFLKPSLCVLKYPSFFVIYFASFLSKLVAVHELEFFRFDLKTPHVFVGTPNEIAQIVKNLEVI